MNLPQIHNHETLTQAVNARDLHSFLQIQTRFNDWIVRRIADYDFTENQDFVTLTQNLVNGGKRTEYAISLDMAKELSMVERNEQGKQARRYFIECEKAYHNSQTHQLSRLEILQIATQAELENISLRTELEMARPKIDHYDRMVNRAGLVNASQIGAKVGLSAVKLNKVLDDFGVYNKSIKRNGRTFNHWFIERGFGEMKQTHTGHEQALFTHAGEAWVIERLIAEGVVS